LDEFRKLRVERRKLAKAIISVERDMAPDLKIEEEVKGELDAGVKGNPYFEGLDISDSSLGSV